MSDKYRVEITTSSNGWNSSSWCAYNDDSTNTLQILHNGMCIQEETDNGAPEDNSFYRDYQWIKAALENAYELGRKDMKDEIYNVMDDINDDNDRRGWQSSSWCGDY